MADLLTHGEAKNSTVDRALLVLEAFLADDRTELSLADLSRLCDLDKSVIHRILATLVRRRFLSQDAVTKRYRVGLRTWEIGQRYALASPLEALAEHALTTLVQQHRYTTGIFATLDDDQIVILFTVRGAGPVNITIDAGTRMPAALTATGRTMLAYLPPAEVEHLAPRLLAQPRAGRRALTKAALQREFVRIRERGYGINQGQYFPGIGTIAFCVRDAGGRPVAALSVDFPMAPETEDLFDVLPPALRAAVGELERATADL